MGELNPLWEKEDKGRLNFSVSVVEMKRKMSVDFSLTCLVFKKSRLCKFKFLDCINSSYILVLAPGEVLKWFLFSFVNENKRVPNSQVIVGLNHHSCHSVLEVC